MAAGLLFCCALPIVRAAVQEYSESGPQASSSSVPAQGQAAKPAPRSAEPLVLIDPGHGGEDKGAVFTGKLLEKDVTLALARELRKELTQRGIAAKMLRDADVNVGLDRRAEIANEPHTALYIALHAGRPGRGVRVYAPMLTSPQPPKGRFLVWDSAQAQSLERSRKLAQAVAKELKRKEVQVTVLGISLRPLNNVVPPAIAVEIAPDPNNVRSLESERMQNTVASAIAAAIAQTRGVAGGHP
ncbi:MAG TPA: N-acetylmuramoyl-L-alanine amidase [Candidatus Angelobacter sp.]